MGHFKGYFEGAKTFLTPKFLFGKKSSKEFHFSYSLLMQLQVALWTYMFLKLGSNNENSIHILPLQSLPLIAFHL